ncbi:peptidyl-tRNA hydrolase, mitochondrial isoform X2 [Phragmites australis]|uniref:peptidyl-tRNA hydrolase, mitochondrial isoform X2 n=1 Tax=Phragmites australis TaxID=29695 RepID=UPI002D799871|nr:peptidyl-tRNA hydrolase, mitochondrial isoform X2 [Phragmites australis]
MRLLSGASASRLPSPLFSLPRARPRCMPTSASATPCRASSSSAAVAGDGAARKPWLFVGLGNPGKVYQGTRHNVGFEMIDVIAEAEGISLSSMQFKAMVGKGRIGDSPIMLAKPQTFMNASGESLVSYFKIPLNQVVVMYDDLDLPFAKLRLLPKGGHGGHNGMRSIINHLKQSRDFPRLRIGIGRPPGKMDPANFVLRPFNKKEQEELDFAFHRGLEAVRIMVLEGFNKSATYVNTSQASEMLNR